MDTLLILLGVFGFGAVIIAVHGFSVAAQLRGERLEREGGYVGERGSINERTIADRRRGLVVAFPLLINGTLVEADRRGRTDRRRQIS